MATWTLRMVTGHWLTDQYLLNDLAAKHMTLEVSDAGDLRDPEYGFELTAERWLASDYITNGSWNFSPDTGELERIKCKIRLCGAAIKQAREL